MARLGRPPRQYLLTRTRVGDEAFKQTEAFFGIRAVASRLSLADAVVGQMLRALGGSFERRVQDKDGRVYIERVERVA